MPVWPVWQLTDWVVDPHYLARLQSVRDVVPRLHEGEEAWRSEPPGVARNRLPTGRINTVVPSQATAQTQGGSNLGWGSTSLSFWA